MPRQMGMPGGGRWWTDAAMVQKLGLSEDQQKRLTEAFLQNRLKLVELSATVQKEELMLEPLLAADRLDEAKTAAQIDRVAQARAELEKTNGRMLLGLRSVLTPDQWKKLQAERPMPGIRRRPEGGPDAASGDPQPRPRR